jgi:LPS-assembly protein
MGAAGRPAVTGRRLAQRQRPLDCRPPRWVRAALCAALLAVIAVAHGPEPAVAAVEAPQPGEPVSFEADNVTYQRESKRIEATGNVVARQLGRTLYCDTLIFDQPENRITAIGNVKVIEPTGEVYEADRLELTGDLKNGVADDLRAVMSDGTRLTAATATRRDGEFIDANNATYTPCFACPENPEAPPLWQVNAVKVRHTQSKQIIEFENAWLEVGGVPVAYVPYFYRPDPSVRRKTGFLFPTVGYDSQLGGVARIPFFWEIDDQQDVTVVPWIITNTLPALEAQYRRAFENGTMRFDGSLAQSPEDQLGGHIFGKVRYDIDQNWRAGSDLERTIYRTYLREYGFSSERTLISRLFGEGFFGDNYFEANAYAFQNLDRGNEQEESPFVAPMLDYFYAGDEDALGGYLSGRLDAVALTRRRGTNTRRVSARGRWDRPYIGPAGNLFTLTGAVYADGYNYDNLDISSNNSIDGSRGRLFPTAAMTWSLPFMRSDSWLQQTVEPIVQVVASPNYGDSRRIPNEDSLDLEIRTTNLFDINPYPGLDRVFEGPRANYGVRWHGYAGDDASATVTFGQTYQFTNANDLNEGTGYGEKLSDYVTSIDLWPKEYLSISYRNRLRHENLDVERNEVSGSVGVDALKLSGSYVDYAEQPEVDQRARKQLRLALDSQLTRFWRSRIEGTRDLRSNSQRLLSFEAIYEDECFLFGTEIFQRNTRDGDLKPTTGFFFRIGFKTLGEITPGYRIGGS